nr:uncharacterized protein LOC113829794 isoform X1 [Penaeus vannamei]
MGSRYLTASTKRWRESFDDVTVESDSSQNKRRSFFGRTSARKQRAAAQNTNAVNMRVDPLFFMVLVWLAMLLVCTPSTVAEGGHARRTKRQFGFSGGVNAVRPITGALLSVTSSNRRPYRPNIIYGPRPTRRRCLHYDRYRRCIYWSRY